MATAVKRILPGHSFTIEHKEEGRIDKCRTRLALSHDTYHRKDNDKGCSKEVFHAMNIEAIARHKLGNGKSRSKLGKLGWLQTQRSKHKPRTGTLDTMRIEDGGKEQQYQGGIDDIREGVVEPVIEQQDNETERDGGSYPDNLHSRTRTKTENIIVAIGIAGTTDTYPSKGEKRQINAYRPPVERTKHTLLSVI